MGLERMAQILQDVPNNYETDLIFPIVQTAAEIAGIDYFSSDEKTKTSLKVIGDHVRAVVHMIADGIRVENTGRGYSLRRVVCLWKIGTKNLGESRCCGSVSRSFRFSTSSSGANILFWDYPKIGLL
jgi:alanyl-tRNA synthetase